MVEIGLSIDGIIDNIKIIDANVYEEKIYAENEIKYIEVKLIYKYTFLDDLVGEMQISTPDAQEAKEIIARELLKKIDRQGMYV